MRATARLILLAGLAWLAAACYDRTEPLPQGSWTLVDAWPLRVPEPSGLCLDADGRHLWTVSDETGLVYRLDLEGRLERSLAFTGEDLEGVCLAPDGGFWLAEEGLRQAVRVSAQGAVLARIPLELHGAANSGLEGVTVGGDGRLLLLNEKNPGRLLRLDPVTLAVESIDLDFALDYSGLCWDAERDGLWVLSDESRALYFLEEGEPPVEYPLGLARLEGVAVVADTAWVVSDAQAKLFRIQLN